MNLTPHQAKYFAHDLTRRSPSGLDRLSMSLFDAAVDLNPHQIEAALFALQSPLSKGVVLADEVGLGKTIEAGIVLCQLWAERRRRLLVLCPASIRKQWALELTEKFNLPVVVLDSRGYREAKRAGRDPLAENAIVVMSFNFANRIRDELKAIAWDLVVIDEAHKLRNAYRPSNKVGQGIRWATEDCRKLLLTATPLQNSLLELYGLSTLIDEHLFGDVNSFRSQYASAASNLDALRQRLAGFCKRTLRNQVTEYIRYTERHAITRPFKPTDDEHALYEAVSAFLQREDSYALPQRQRHLTALILRKLLASSSQAIAATLETLRSRLESLHDEQARSDPEFTENLVEGEEIEDELLDEILAEPDELEGTPAGPVIIDRQKLRDEINVLQRLATWARGIGIDTKTRTLLRALDIGFQQMAATGGARKAVVFTESRRTQDYLKTFLESHGYQGQVVLFNGTNGGPEATAIYERWAEKNRESGRASGSRAIDVRTALIEHFRDGATILLATEAAAEGVNLQFCSLVVNYDLPWNPQRIEQRIGRCHRYGQKHDVVVINFLNERNAADQRVLELLAEKFKLFDGVFGASDEVLGAIESGVDFESRILAIYQECRTPEEIDAAFRKLQAEMDEQIRTRLDDTRRKLFEYFDEDVHQRLRLQLADAQAQLDRVGKRFWAVTRFMLDGRARFDDDALAFDLDQPPRDDIPNGRYHLISKSQPRGDSDGGDVQSVFLYRISHPLGEHVVDGAKALPTPSARLVFDVTHHPVRVRVVEALRGKSGYLTLTRLAIDSYEREEYRHSSWASLLADRMELDTRLRIRPSVRCIAIDDFEYPDLQGVLEWLSGDVHHATAAVRSKPQGRPTASGFSANHEYAVFWGTPDAKIGRLPRIGSKAERYPYSDDKGVYAWANFRKSGTDSDRPDRPKSYYPVYVAEGKLRVPNMTWNEDDREWTILEEPLEHEVAVWPIDPANAEKVWTCSPERAREELDDIRSETGNAERIEIYKKYRPNQEGALPGTWWDDAGYSASESGTKVLKDLFGAKDFDYPKSINLVVDCLRVCGATGTDLVLDYFAGSGTTAHAVINLNREDGARRRFVLIEMGEYFDTILLPRIKKVTFTPEWSDGNPNRMATEDESRRSPRIVKVIRLESYEDALNNLELRRPAAQRSLLDTAEAQGADKLKEQYILRYMLDVETRGSQSLLNVRAFTDPTAYKLKVKRPGSDESREVNVDLLETFNWLIGLTVQHIAAPQAFSASFERDSEKRLRLKRRLKADDGGPYWFRTVTGTTPDGRKTLVIWRKRPGGETPDGIEQDNLVLDEWFTKQGYSSKDSEFDLIYVNGSNNLENLKAPDDTRKVRLIEEDFHRLMFETEDV